MKTTEIRQKFIDYFTGKQHEPVPSSSLVPGNDATLLFTNAGMVQFKDVFLGDETRGYHRAVTSQRCVRAGGKHNDLENVGYTARHHTFFEMLGNFSFGDYFKHDAIHFAWQLLTGEFGIPAEKLWITVFEEDDEAAEIWIKDIGVPAERVTRIGAKDNFWQMGDTGPCGPCSEIFFDHGPDVEGGPPGTPEEDGDRFVEIWNLVFMQYNRSTDGKLEPLPKPSVDTGMGLERIAAVLQGVHSNYETDMFQNLIHKTAQVIGSTDLDNKSLRVIADHIRSTSFLIVDGVTPSNEGRGYVLRRIIRRAVRHGYHLGCRDAFLHQLVQPLVKEMGDAYPELKQKSSLIEKILSNENEKFNETLESGLKILDQEIDLLDGDVIPGDVVFKLYDTFGFPSDLTADVARERNLRTDSAGFDKAMEQQRARARAASQFVQGAAVRIDGVSPSTFIGYHELNGNTTIQALIKDEDQVSELKDGDTGILVANETPFCAESGGQVGDTGRIVFPLGVFQVTNTQYLANKVIGHFGIAQGSIRIQEEGDAQVDSSIRNMTKNNHSATHLLHASLKSVLGEHVQQKGSLVDSNRLRFDFSHFEPITDGELGDIEQLVNQYIRENHVVSENQMKLDDAKAAGAEALFGEKYSADVRVIKMGGRSFELCGGTHVNQTGDIGFFKIVNETGIAAGVRRIEAMTGEAAETYIVSQTGILNQASGILKTRPEELVGRISGLLAQQKEQQQQIHFLQTRLATSGNTASDLVREVAGIKVVVIRQDNTDVKSLRMAVDQWKEKLKTGVVLVCGENDGKVTLIGGVTDDLCDRYHAGELIKILAALVGGKGGGKPTLAQGGGGNAEGLAQIESRVHEWVKSPD
ncbi:MAG: alanine--tRNA ligase [Gammaproteobacteria bacterium]|nr:alanine--tRNA ligase [Gammaproteobacteria bacterium]